MIGMTQKCQRPAGQNERKKQLRKCRCYGRRRNENVPSCIAIHIKSFFFIFHYLRNVKISLELARDTSTLFLFSSYPSLCWSPCVRVHCTAYNVHPTSSGKSDKRLQFNGITYMPTTFIR